MRFEWDERKRLSNLRKHGLDFRDAHSVFDGPTYTFEDDRFEYSETRFVTLGFLAGIVVSLIHTESPSVIRILSFRKATRYENSLLYKSLKD